MIKGIKYQDDAVHLMTYKNKQNLSVDRFQSLALDQAGLVD